MKTRIFITLCALLPAALAAQETLSLSRCRELALKYNKEMAAASKQTESARYTVRSYRGNFFPNFTLSGTGAYSTFDGNFQLTGGNLPVLSPDPATGQLAPNGTYAYFPGISLDYKGGLLYSGGLQVEQPLYMGGKIRAAYRMAQTAARMAEKNEALTESNVILQTDQAYSLLVKAQEMQKVAQSYHEVLEELLKNVESAYRHGLKPKNDVLKVQVKLNESELAIRKAENARRLAAMNLCRLLGRPLTEDICIENSFPEVEESTVGTTDISARPEYAILTHQVDMARQQVRLSRSELLPQVGLRGSYDYLHGLEVNNETLLNKGCFTLFLNVSIPLFHFGERSNKVKAARAKLEQARLQQEDLNEQMTLELVQAANNLDEARLESELADRSLAQAEENREVSRNQYEVGLETLSDHLEAQAMWQQAYQTRVDARFQLYLSYVKYLKAAGKLQEYAQ